MTVPRSVLAEKIGELGLDLATESEREENP